MYLHTIHLRHNRQKENIIINELFFFCTRPYVGIITLTTGDLDENNLFIMDIFRAQKVLCRDKSLSDSVIFLCGFNHSSAEKCPSSKIVVYARFTHFLIQYVYILYKKCKVYIFEMPSNYSFSP